MFSVSTYTDFEYNPPTPKPIFDITTCDFVEGHYEFKITGYKKDHIYHSKVFEESIFLFQQNPTR